MRARKMPAVSRGGGIRFRSVICTGVKRALRVGTTLLASVAMLTAGTAFAVDEDMSETKLADSDTRNTYTESFGTTNSTRYAGRIWTDKSVSTDSIQFGDDIEVEKDNSDFLVTYSAMATSQIITGQAPTDTVFILDLSASMTWGYSDPQEADKANNSRLYAMVNAVNSAIDELVKSNPQNRIAIVAFSGNLPETQLLPALTTGEELQKKVTDGEYLSLINWDQGENGDDGGNDPHRKDNDDASADVICRYNENTVGTAGGTNIQAGLFAGMRILASTQDTTYTMNGTEVTRIPNVVFMSDGAPTTFSSAEDAQYKEYEDSDSDEGLRTCTEKYLQGTITTSTPVCRNNSKVPVYSGSWWETNSGKQIGAGDNDNPDSADGVMALLTAAYFKDRITEQYYGSTESTNQANVYTVGFGTDVQNREMAMMANIVLNPSKYLDDAESFKNAEQDEGNNAEIQQVYAAVKQYFAKQDAVMQGSIGDGGNSDEITFVIRSNEDHPSSDLTSVNYPTRAFTANDDESLNDALTQIAGLITEHAKIPTEVDSDDSDGNASGYITYVDPIGEYMHVDSVKSLIWAGKQFNVVSSSESGGTKTYTFSTVDSSDSIDSPVYGQHSVNDIIVTTYDVLKTEDVPAHQELTVQIPANSIPLRVNTVTLNGKGEPITNESNGALPLRLVYGVSLNAGVMNNGRVDSSVVLSNYVNNHQDSASGGNVLFYTNLYSGNPDPNDPAKTLGDATVTFTPAKDNPFYYMQEDTPLYTCTIDSEGNVTGEPQQATGEFYLDQQYCFKSTYYEDNNDGKPIEQPMWVNRLGSDFRDGSVGSNKNNNQLYLKAGSPRLGNLQDISRDKTANPTNTATRRLRPTLDETNSKFVVHLGNNGRMAVAPPVQPGTANVTVQKTFAGREWNDSDTFKFTLKPTGFNESSAPLPTPQGDVVTVDSEKRIVTVMVGKPSSGKTNKVILNFTFPVGSLVNTNASTVYTYEIRENEGQLPAVSYDTHIATVTITVSPDSNDSDNMLDTRVSVKNTDAPNQSDRNVKDAAAFTNTFVSVSALPLTGGDATARNLILAGGGILLLAGVAWLLARRRRV